MKSQLICLLMTLTACAPDARIYETADSEIKERFEVFNRNAGCKLFSVAEPDPSAPGANGIPISRPTSVPARYQIGRRTGFGARIDIGIALGDLDHVLLHEIGRQAGYEPIAESSCEIMAEQRSACLGNADALEFIAQLKEDLGCLPE